MSQPTGTEGKGKGKGENSGGQDKKPATARKNVLRWDAALALSNDGPFLGGDTQVKLEVVTGRDSDSSIGFSVIVPIGTENEETGFGVQFIPTAESPEIAKFNLTGTHRIRVSVTNRAAAMPATRVATGGGGEVATGGGGEVATGGGGEVATGGGGEGGDEDQTHGYDTNVGCRSNFRASSSPSVSST
jgi:hypothetical protein